MADTDFVYVLDDNYAPYLEIGLSTLAAFQPEATVFVYDVGATPSHRLQDICRRQPRASYRFWPEADWLSLPWVDTLDFAYFHQRWSLLDELKYLSRRWRSKFFGRTKSGWLVDKEAFAARKRRIIRIWAQKPVCIRDCLGRTVRNLVFLDADAFVWRDLAPVFAKPFDVGLTLRRLEDVKIGIDAAVACPQPVPYHAINAGVIYLRNNAAAGRFVDLWLAELAHTRYFMVEQTALSQLVMEADAEAFRQYEKPLRLGGPDAPIAVLLLPCERYNNTYVGNDLAFDAAETFVVHFKGHLKQDAYIRSLKAVVTRRIAQAPAGA